MKLKRLKKIQVNSFIFPIRWTDKHDGGSFSFDCDDRFIEIGTKGNHTLQIFQVISHELWELAALECGVRLNRPDCLGDFIFVYDHRQHDTMCNMHAALLAQFIE